VLCIALLICGNQSTQADEFDAALHKFRTGDYSAALQAAEEATKPHYAEARWWQLRLECLLTLGRYADGAKAFDLSQRQHPTDAPIRVAAYDLLRLAGVPERAQSMLAELLRFAETTPWRYSSPEDRIAVGRAASRMGADAREILENYYDEAQKIDPDLRDGYVAVGELALAKNDLAVAADTFRAGLKKFADDPDLLYGLARAVAETSDDESHAHLEAALKVNPRHIASLLYQAEEHLVHEEYKEAAAALDDVARINARHPRAWALRAVLCHLQADPFGEWYCREEALAPWDGNPEVDHVLGSRLSKAYRFAEGAKYQRRALRKDPNYLPARAQLAQDLLRLGEADEGWRLVNEVQQADPYDVPAYNLATLKDRLDAYTTLTTPHFKLHMERREAAVYGRRVLDLLERARTTLGNKYGWQPERPVTVEILTRQQDFAIRTFGLPGGDGILGVCFGYVITANSPAALAGNNTNWEATLWHEYCHVVTLEKTRHRIPRWLSEGISVYEERQANKAWGDRLDRDLRRMILAGELTPVSKLNEAFRRPKSGEHFNLAYYEASLAVEYLVESLGQGTLARVLDDVGAGMPINESLERRTGSLAGFDKAFDKYARERATAYGPKVDWSEEDLPKVPQGPSASIAKFLEENPKHFLARLRYGRALLEEKQFDKARTVLEALVSDAPQWAGDESPYALLAQTHRERQDTAAERNVLEQSAERSDDALETYRRLIELAIAAKDTAALHRNVERYLGVQPLDEFAYRSLAEQTPWDVAAKSAESAKAVAAARSLLALEPDDLAGTHYLLARRLHAAEDAEAKRHTLLALEETPRYREAQQLLLKIVDEKKAADAKPKQRPPTTPRRPTMVEP
jgi:predicted Zn-dependent protease